MDDICKYCNFTIQPMVMDKDGTIVPRGSQSPRDAQKEIPLNPRERAFLLLTSRLGNPDRQGSFYRSAAHVGAADAGQGMRPPEQEMTRQDFIELGYDRETAERYCALLSDTQELDYYLSRGRKMDCTPVTRVSEDYPGILRQRLGLDCPGCCGRKGSCLS